MGPEWFWPPEAVAAILEVSDPSSVVANIAAWLAEAIHHELAMGVSTANIGATLSQFIGLGGAAYGATGTGLNLAGLEPLAAHCLKQLAIGQAAVEANSIAKSAVIPSVLCQGNRDEFVVDNNINPWVWGALTPRIADLEAEYTEFWGQNTSAGVAYATTLNTLSGGAAVPPPFSPMGASPAAVAGPAESVADSAAQDGLQAAEPATQAMSSPGTAMQFLQPLQQVVSSVPEAAQSVGQVPTQIFQSASQTISSPVQSIMGMFPSLMSQSGAAAAADALPVEAVAGPVGAGGGAVGGLGAATGGGAVGVGYPGAGLTSFTRPASTFGPGTGGRPMGLAPGALLNAAEVRGPTTGAGSGAGAMPVSPAAAGMLGREGVDAGKDKVAHARIVVDQYRQDAD